MKAATAVDDAGAWLTTARTFVEDVGRQVASGYTSSIRGSRSVPMLGKRAAHDSGTLRNEP